MSISLGKRALRLSAMLSLAALAACATPPPPPPPAPPPPAPAPTPAPIPSRPQPPNGASLNTPVPPTGVDGVRMTVNAHLSPAAKAWNLRSALNVAALNCVETHYAAILPAYKEFLTKNERRLAKINKEVDEEFRKTHGGKAYRTERDQYMTQVYNYFALPPARQDFCTEAVAVSQEFVATPPEDLEAYSDQALMRLERVFNDFYRRFEDWKVAVAQWDAQYGELYGATQPGYVAAANYAPLSAAGAAPAEGQP